MESKKIIYDKPNENEVNKEIKYNQKKGYDLHHYGWINNKFELGFVKQ